MWLGLGIINWGWLFPKFRGAAFRDSVELRVLLTVAQVACYTFVFDDNIHRAGRYMEIWNNLGITWV